MLWPGLKVVESLRYYLMLTLIYQIIWNNPKLIIFEKGQPVIILP